MPRFATLILFWLTLHVIAFAESFPANAVQRLAIDVSSGNLLLTATDENIVTVSSEATPETILANGTLTIRRSGDADKPIRIALPPDADVTARLERGDLRIERLSGNFDLRVRGGSLTLLGATGAFDATVETGSLQARVFLNGESRFRTERGNLDIAILDTVSYSFDVRTKSGNIILTLPEDYSADLYATTVDGSIRSRIPVNLVLEPHPNGDSQKRLTGTLGEGGSPATLTTERGDIEILPFKAFETEPTPSAGWTIPKARTAIRVDGQLEGAWLDAPVIPIPYADANSSGEAQLLWDDTHIYLAFVSRESDWNVKMAGVGPDSSLLDKDDTIELFAYHEDMEFQVAVNPIGTVLDTANGDKTWDSGAVVRTALYPTGWVTEMALPRKSLPEMDELAVIRSMPRTGVEFAASGVPVFTEVRPADEPRVTLTFKGDAAIRVRETAATLGYLRNGQVRIADIPRIERNLMLSGLFGTVQIALDTEKGQAYLLLPDAESAPPYAEVAIVGASDVPVSTLRERFGLSGVGSLGAAVSEHRRTLMEAAYAQWGYTYARVSLAPERSRVTFRVDEGIVDAIRVEGATRVPEEAVIEALRSRIGRPYQTEAAAQAFKDAHIRLKERHKELKRFWDAGVSVEENRRVWTVRVEENPPVNVNRIPLWNYTRVHGAELGLETRLSRGEPSRYRAIVGATYLHKIRRRDADNLHVNYHAGFLAYQNDSRTLGVGAEWKRTTLTHPWQGDNNPFSNLLQGSESQDYFSAEGGELFVQARFHPRFAVEGGVGMREDTSLRQTFPWSILKQKGFRGNRAFSDGRFQYARLNFSLDGRNVQAMSEGGLHPRPKRTIRVRSGIWSEVSLESGLFDPLDYSLGEKRRETYGYGLIRGDIRLFVPLGKRMALDSRLRAQWTDSPLPSQLQMWVGGGSTLRSMTDGNWKGDNGWVWNVETRVQPTRYPILVGAFLDAGQVWFGGTPPASRTIQYAGGIALEAILPKNPYPDLEIFRAEFAAPMHGDVTDSHGESLNEARLRLLLSRPF